MIKCNVPGCKNDAFGMFGTSWVCGECLNKLLVKEAERKAKMVEGLLE